MFKSKKSNTKFIVDINFIEQKNLLIIQDQKTQLLKVMSDYVGGKITRQDTQKSLQELKFIVNS